MVVVLIARPLALLCRYLLVLAPLVLVLLHAYLALPTAELVVSVVVLMFRPTLPTAVLAETTAELSQMLQRARPVIAPAKLIV